MARLLYQTSAAEFATELAAQVELLDADELSFDPQRFGRPAAIPLTERTFSVYTQPEAGSLTTDLLDDQDVAITELTTSTDFATLGRPQDFQGPDGHEGPLFISGDGGTTFYKVEPSTATLFSRLGAVENMPTTDLADWSDTAPGDGEVPTWNETMGEWQPTAGITPLDLDDLADVDTTGVADGQRLAYDSGTSSWTPVDPIESHNHSGADITSGTVDVARLPVGSNSWQVAAGNHGHSISGVSGLQTALDAKVNVADVAKVHPVIGAEDPTPAGAVDGDIIVRRQA